LEVICETPHTGLIVYIWVSQVGIWLQRKRNSKKKELRPMPMMVVGQGSRQTKFSTAQTSCLALHINREGGLSYGLKIMISHHNGCAQSSY